MALSEAKALKQNLLYGLKVWLTTIFVATLIYTGIDVARSLINGWSVAEDLSSYWLILLINVLFSVPAYFLLTSTLVYFSLKTWSIVKKKLLLSFVAIALIILSVCCLIKWLESDWLFSMHWSDFSILLPSYIISVVLSIWFYRLDQTEKQPSYF